MVTMTREECLLKLLAVEPETRERIAMVTGWPPGESDRVLDRLLAQRRVTYGSGPHPTGRRLFYPTDEGAEALRMARLMRLVAVSQKERQIRRAIRATSRSIQRRT